MIHCSGKGHIEAPTVIQDGSVVQAGVILHGWFSFRRAMIFRCYGLIAGCILEEGAVVGKGSQVLDQAKIEKNGALAPGSLLLQGKGVT